MSIPDHGGFALADAAIALLILGAALASVLVVRAPERHELTKVETTSQATALLDELQARAQYFTAAEIERLATANTGRFPPPLQRFSWKLQSARVIEVPGLFEIYMVVSWGSGALRTAARITPADAGPQQPMREASADMPFTGGGGVDGVQLSRSWGWRACRAGEVPAPGDCRG